MLRVLFVGDVYGKPGRRVLASHLPTIKNRFHFVIVNGENAAGGFGLNRESFGEITRAGADCVTLGNHAWHHKEVFGLLDDPRLVRPLNMPIGTPGSGYQSFDVKGDSGSTERLTVVNALGRVFMEATHNPFLAMDELLAHPNLGAVFLDFHAEATSEKAAMGQYLAAWVAAEPRLELMAPAAINIVCFRYVGTGGTEAELKALNTEIMLRIQESGIAVLTDTTLAGRHSLRAAINNHRTKRADLDMVIAEVLRHGQALQG